MAEHFYRITVILRDGKKMEGIREHTSSDVDTVYLIYQRQAEDRFGGNLDSFDCVQVSIRHKDVKKYLKKNQIHRMSNDHHPEEEWWMNHENKTQMPALGRSRKQSMDRNFGKGAR